VLIALSVAIAFFSAPRDEEGEGMQPELDSLEGTGDFST
jgi:hypothetical protein